METSPSLLERLRQPVAEQVWARFVDLYTPHLYYWATRRAGLPQEEAGDLVQEVLVVLLQKLPEFTHDPQRSFRGWLAVYVAKFRVLQRLREELQGLLDF